MLDRCLQLASSPEERCVEFLVYGMSVFITCENPLLLLLPSFSVSSLPNFLVFLLPSPSLLPHLLILLPLSPPSPPTPLSSSSSYPPLLLLLPPSPPPPPPPPTPLLLFISPAILVTCVKQYSMYDLSAWRREERGSLKSPMTSLSSGWVTIFPSWLTTAPNHNSSLLLEKYAHFPDKMKHAISQMQTPRFNGDVPAIQTGTLYSIHAAVLYMVSAFERLCC